MYVCVRGHACCHHCPTRVGVARIGASVLAVLRTQRIHCRPFVQNEWWFDFNHAMQHCATCFVWLHALLSSSSTIAGRAAQHKNNHGQVGNYNHIQTQMHASPRLKMNYVSLLQHSSKTTLQPALCSPCIEILVTDRQCSVSGFQQHARYNFMVVARYGWST